MSDLWQIGGWVGGTIVTVVSIFAGVKKAQQASNQRNESSRTELIKLLEDSRNEWRNKCESEHTEFQKYRDEAHLQLNQATQKILTLSTENAELKMRTDMAPIMTALKDQGNVLERVVKVVEKLESSIVQHLQYLQKPPT